MISKDFLKLALIYIIYREGFFRQSKARSTFSNILESVKSLLFHRLYRSTRNGVKFTIN